MWDRMCAPCWVATTVSLPTPASNSGRFVMHGCRFHEISAVGWQVDFQMLISLLAWPSLTVTAYADLAALSCRPPTV